MSANCLCSAMLPKSEFWQERQPCVKTGPLDPHMAMLQIYVNSLMAGTLFPYCGNA